MDGGRERERKAENSRINLMQDGQDFLTENYKIFRKGKEDLVNVKVIEYLSTQYCKKSAY